VTFGFALLLNWFVGNTLQVECGNQHHSLILCSLIDALQEGFVSGGKRALADLQWSEPHQASQARRNIVPRVGPGFLPPAILGAPGGRARKPTRSR